MTTGQLSDTDIFRAVQALVVGRGMMSQAKAETLVTGDRCSRIASDGSTRRFWRLAGEGGPSCLIVAPAGRSGMELAEARSAWKIGAHLREKGVPVPELYGWDGDTGVLLFEDLGDLRLHDLVKSAGGVRSRPDDPVAACYRSVLEHLAAMQCLGAQGFDPSWCWDSGRYDLELMVDKESGYFLRAFWQGLLGHETAEGVLDELGEIARLAAAAPADYFLHRDFQCRNIMLKEGAVRFIDFQGGRLGPLGYDLASLVIDPYSRLPQWFQDELVGVYLAAIGRYLAVDEAEFKKQFQLLAFQRNMQIVGAFSFLYQVRQKPFFLDFIVPSLESLKIRLAAPLFQNCPLLRTMVNSGLQEMARV